MFLHSDFDSMYFGYKAIHETVGVLTNNKNSMEVGAASAGGRETLGLY